ncbi:AAA family ATPase [Planosporangium thailandense]|uniref:AAA family ATPase n=1 Tax=Planosporangium thailandense TaxID=765197 RepID=A0ABX0Y715_9ACTN|nr:AAA family ATPase [Planosporangium thailandense]
MTTPPTATLVPFVGRESEVFRLGSAWGASARGRPGLFVITGAAGIGKTRVAAEVARLARDTGGAVLAARCHEAERSLVLQPVVEAVGRHAATLPPEVLRRLAGQRAAALAALVPGLASALGPRLTTAASRAVPRHLAEEAVTAFLRALADREPVLLLVDDLHHAGSATVGLLREVARGAGGRLLVVATVRTPTGDPVLDALSDVATRLDLGPLAPTAVTRMVTAAGWAERADDIRDRTRGHPLFVVETVRALATGATRVPDSLEAAVLDRLRRVGEDTGQILRAAAVLGTTVDPATLARLVDLPLPQTAGHCEVALSAGLLAAVDDGYEFTHDLARELLCSTTPAAVRAVYHARAADLLSHRPEAMAAHAAAVGDWSRAARGWLLAGSEAARQLAADDAEALLTRAAEAARRAGDVAAETLAAAGLRELAADGPAEEVHLPRQR